MANVRRFERRSHLNNYQVRLMERKYVTVAQPDLVVNAPVNLTPLPASPICDPTPASPKTSDPDRTSPLRRGAEQE